MEGLQTFLKGLASKVSKPLAGALLLVMAAVTFQTASAYHNQWNPYQNRYPYAGQCAPFNDSLTIEDVWFEGGKVKARATFDDTFRHWYIDGGPQQQVWANFQLIYAVGPSLGSVADDQPNVLQNASQVVTGNSVVVTSDLPEDTYLSEGQYNGRGVPQFRYPTDYVKMLSPGLRPFAYGIYTCDRATSNAYRLPFPDRSYNVEDTDGPYTITFRHLNSTGPDSANVQVTYTPRTGRDASATLSYGGRTLQPGVGQTFNMSDTVHIGMSDGRTMWMPRYSNRESCEVRYITSNGTDYNQLRYAGQTTSIHWQGRILRVQSPFVRYVFDDGSVGPWMASTHETGPKDPSSSYYHSLAVWKKNRVDVPANAVGIEQGARTTEQRMDVNNTNFVGFCSSGLHTMGRQNFADISAYDQVGPSIDFTITNTGNTVDSATVSCDDAWGVGCKDEMEYAVINDASMSCSDGAGAKNPAIPAGDWKTLTLTNGEASIPLADLNPLTGDKRICGYAEDTLSNATVSAPEKLDQLPPVFDSISGFDSSNEVVTINGNTLSGTLGISDNLGLASCQVKVDNGEWKEIAGCVSSTTGTVSFSVHGVPYMYDSNIEFKLTDVAGNETELVQEHKIPQRPEQYDLVSAGYPFWFSGTSLKWGSNIGPVSTFPPDWRDRLHHIVNFPFTGSRLDSALTSAGYGITAWATPGQNFSFTFDSEQQAHANGQLADTYKSMSCIAGNCPDSLPINTCAWGSNNNYFVGTPETGFVVNFDVNDDIVQSYPPQFTLRLYSNNIDCFEGAAQRFFTHNGREYPGQTPGFARDQFGSGASGGSNVGFLDSYRDLIIGIRHTDDVAPVVNSFTINNGANTTRNKLVTLNIDASDNITDANALDCLVESAGVSITASCNGDVAFTLPGGPGLKTVTVTPVDPTAEEPGKTGASVSATINLLDDDKPIVDSLVINGGQTIAFQNTNGTFLTGTAVVVDDVQTTCYMHTSSLDGQSAATITSTATELTACDSFTYTIPFETISGDSVEKTVYFYAIDAGDLISDEVSRTLTVKNQPSGDFIDLGLQTCPLQNAGYAVAIEAGSIDNYKPEQFKIQITPNTTFSDYRNDPARTTQEIEELDTFYLSYSYYPGIWPVANSNFDNEWKPNGAVSQRATWSAANGTYELTFGEFPADSTTLTPLTGPAVPLSNVEFVHLYNQYLGDTSAGSYAPCGFSSFPTANLNVIADTTAPTVTVTGLPTDWVQSGSFSPVITCSDAEAGCAELTYSFTNDGTAACMTNLPSTIETCADPENCTVASALTSHGFLHVQAKDSHDPVNSECEIHEVFIDTSAPTLNSYTISDTDGDMQHANGTYYTSETTGYEVDYDITEEPKDLPSNACTFLGHTFSCVEGSGTETIGETFTEGTHTLSLKVTDNAGRESAEENITLIVDAQNPTIGGSLTVAQNEADRAFVVTLPQGLADLGDAGVDVLELSLTETSGTDDLDYLLNNETASTNDGTAVDTTSGKVVVNVANGVTFEQITVAGLDDTKTYKVHVKVTDKAGNSSQESTTDLTFDTLPPEIINASYTNDTFNTRGDGLNEGTAFKVGADNKLPLTLELRDDSNSTNGTPTETLTVTANFDGTNLVTVDTLCDGLLPNTTATCTELVEFDLPASFENGNVEFRVLDGAGNEGNRNYWVRQNDNGPTLGANFSLRHNFMDTNGDALHHKISSLTYTVEDISNDDIDGIFAFVTYREADANEPSGEKLTTKHARLSDNLNTDPNGTPRHEFTVNLGNMIDGAQDLQIRFEDSYGNAQLDNGSPQTHTTPAFFDAASPVLEGYSYSWVGDTITMNFDSITDASFPITFKAFKKEAGTYGDATIALAGGTQAAELAISESDNTAAAAGNGFTLEIANVDPANVSEVRVEINDKVYTVSGGNVIEEGVTETQFMVRSILISVAEAGEELKITYALGKRENSNVDLTVADIQSLEVEVTSDYGYSETFTLNNPLPGTSGEVGTITVPLEGDYTFETTLVFTDTTPTFQNTITHSQTTDIITPRARFVEIEEEANTKVTFQDGKYYVLTTNSHIHVAYEILPQFENYQVAGQSHYDDTLPITAQISGGFTPNGLVDVITDNTTQTGPFEIEFDVNVQVDDTYTLTTVISDGSRNYEDQIVVVKDTSGPQTTLSLQDDSDADVTLSYDNNGTPTLLTKDYQSLQITALIENEAEAITFEDEELVQIAADGTETAIAITATPVDTAVNANTKTRTYELPELATDGLYRFDATVKDIAGNPSANDPIYFQIDNTAPVVTGDPVFPNQNTVNPLPLTGVTVTDASPIFYELTTDENAAVRTPYNGAVALTEGANTNISLVFVDALGNAADAKTKTGETFTDSIAPTFLLTFIPDILRTKDPEIEVRISTIVEATHDQVDYEITNGGNVVVGTGTILEAAYTGEQVIGTVTLNDNEINPILVNVRDGLNNTIPQGRNVIKDLRGPDASNFVDSLDNAGPLTRYTFDVYDHLDGTIAEVKAAIFNRTTGERFEVNSNNPLTHTAGNPTSGTGSYLAQVGELARPGHEYEIEVTAKDALDNEQITLSGEKVLQAPSDIDNGNPLNDGPDLTGTLLDGDTLTNIDIVDADGNVICNARNLPKGKKLILADVLAQCNLDKLPVGDYTIEITDNNGNTVTIPYTVTPYFFDTNGDINGDGFGAGISDHKILQIEVAKPDGAYASSDADVATALQTIRDAIENRITTEILKFLKDAN